MQLDTADILDIHQLINRYGHVLDDQSWSQLDDVFTPDVILDFSSLGLDVLTGLDAVRALMSDYRNPPRAHHATNIVVSVEDGEPRAVSKGLMLLASGVVSSWVYRDRFRRTERGWRICHRTGIRVADSTPA